MLWATGYRLSSFEVPERRSVQRRARTGDSELPFVTVGSGQ